MSSRLNVLLHGEANDAAEELDGPATAAELRFALVNALRRISLLEAQIRRLQELTRPRAAPIGHGG